MNNIQRQLCYIHPQKIACVEKCAVKGKPLRNQENKFRFLAKIMGVCGDTHELVALILLEILPLFCANNSEFTRKPKTRPNLG